MGFPRALVDALAAKFRTTVPEFAEVYSEWPENNQAVLYPCLTVLSVNPVYQRHPAYRKSIGAVASNKATVLHVIGNFDIGIQLDIATKYKLQRDTMLDLTWKVLEPTTPGGLTLTLTGYYDEIVGITQTGYKFLDTAESVARKEWRALVELTASCRAISTTEEFVITQAPVLVFDTPATI